MMNTHPFLLVPALGLLSLSLFSGAATAAVVGVNFVHADFLDNTGIQAGETADGISGANWNNFAIQGAGGTTAGGTGNAGGINVVWHAANPYAAGSEAVIGTDASQQLFRVYLDDGDGGSGYFAGDSWGVTVQLSGLAAFLGANNADSFNLKLYFSTDSAAFRTADIRLGNLPAVATATAVSDLPSLGTISAELPLGDGTYPTGAIPGGTATDGSRSTGTLTGLTADSLTIAIPSTGDGRGSLAGFAVIPVPEPGSMLLGLLGLAPLLGRRRRTN